MATTTVPVVFGYAPAGSDEAGRTRIEIPENQNPSTFRSGVRRGRIAMHGPSSRHEANIGIGFRFAYAYMRNDGWGGRKQDGWNVGDRATVVDDE